MGRVFSLLLIVAGIWVGLEFYQNGPQGAFGGSLASLFGEEAVGSEERESTPRRAGSSVERVHQENEARFDRMVGD